MASDDAEFVSNMNTRRVHRGTREDGPECGQTMQSGPATVDAENPLDAVLTYGLRPCSKCIDHSRRLGILFIMEHTATVVHQDREEIVGRLPWNVSDDE